MTPVKVAVAGSSGSIGTQTLDVVRAEGDRYEVDRKSTRLNSSHT